MPISKSPCVLFVSSFPPRECGIATFTQDLVQAIDKHFSRQIKTRVLAINDNGTSFYNYPKKVAMQLNETEIEDYINCAHEINKSADIKVVNIQHEYGLFGGDWGDYLLPFLELLHKPIVVTFHTVLPRPNDKLLSVTRAIAQKAAQIVVMTQNSAQVLNRYYKIPKSKITIIPHGVHSIPFPNKKKAKAKLNLTGHVILSTFGMLNRDKGIEYAIEALPELVSEYPNLLYLILGATHPIVRRHEGEKYRNKLKRLVMQLKLKDNVKFYNKYLSLEELIDYLKATDIYLSPTLNPKQAVSGTVSYALSCACPVITTKNQYAKGVISENRGMLVRFRNAADIKNALKQILEDKTKERYMQKNAYLFSRKMAWVNVASAYFKVFNTTAKIVPRRQDKLPPFNLKHLKTLTDDFGIIQFARLTKPDPHSGYSLDDAARALLVVARYYRQNSHPSILNLVKIYLKFIKFTQKRSGKFHNFVSHQKTIIKTSESEDALGRAVWALGYVVSASHLPTPIRKTASQILNKALPWTKKLHSLRAIAFSLLGINCLAQKDKKYLKLINQLANKLVKHFNKNATPTWQWFENCLTYSNYKLPESLLVSFQATGNPIFKKVGEQALKFIIGITFEKNKFVPIGQDGWYFKGGKRSYFDQQPEETAAAVEALVVAHQTTKDKEYKKLAETAFAWFLGKNHLHQMIYDESTGGCYDGLAKFSLNFNQGAESTIVYLLARLIIEEIK
ncbi:glycosyltransferase [Candidatus Parcubacteria bacterium]|nr:MAG: glycosyltransferase [Candidatus Parcubacteria bacterium]